MEVRRVMGIHRVTEIRRVMGIHKVTEIRRIMVMEIRRIKGIHRTMEIRKIMGRAMEIRKIMNNGNHTGPQSHGNQNMLQNNAMHGISQMLMQGMSQNMTNGISHNIMQGMPQNLMHGMPHNVMQGMSQNLLHGIPSNLFQAIPQNMNNGIPQNMTNGIPQNMANGMPQNMTNMIPQNMSNGLLQTPTQNMSVQDSLSTMLQKVLNGLPPNAIQALMNTTLPIANQDNDSNAFEPSMNMFSQNNTSCRLPSMTPHLPQMNSRLIQNQMTSHFPQNSMNIPQISMASHLPQISIPSHLTQPPIPSNLSQTPMPTNLSQFTMPSNMSQFTMPSHLHQTPITPHLSQMSMSSHLPSNPLLTHNQNGLNMMPNGLFMPQPGPSSLTSFNPVNLFQRDAMSVAAQNVAHIPEQGMSAAMTKSIIELLMKTPDSTSQANGRPSFQIPQANLEALHKALLCPDQQTYSPLPNSQSVITQVRKPSSHMESSNMSGGTTSALQALNASMQNVLQQEAQQAASHKQSNKRKNDGQQGSLCSKKKSSRHSRGNNSDLSQPTSSTLPSPVIEIPKSQECAFLDSEHYMGKPFPMTSFPQVSPLVSRSCSEAVVSAPSTLTISPLPTVIPQETSSIFPTLSTTTPLKAQMIPFTVPDQPLLPFMFPPFPANYVATKEDLFRSVQHIPGLGKELYDCYVSYRDEQPKPVDSESFIQGKDSYTITDILHELRRLLIQKGVKEEAEAIKVEPGKRPTKDAEEVAEPGPSGCKKAKLNNSGNSTAVVVCDANSSNVSKKTMISNCSYVCGSNLNNKNYCNVLNNESSGKVNFEVKREHTPTQKFTKTFEERFSLPTTKSKIARTKSIEELPITSLLERSRLDKGSNPKTKPFIPNTQLAVIPPFKATPHNTKCVLGKPKKYDPLDDKFLLARLPLKKDEVIFKIPRIPNKALNIYNIAKNKDNQVITGSIKNLILTLSSAYHKHSTLPVINSEPKCDNNITSPDSTKICPLFSDALSRDQPKLEDDFGTFCKTPKTDVYHWSDQVLKPVHVQDHKMYCFENSPQDHYVLMPFLMEMFDQNVHAEIGELLDMSGINIYECSKIQHHMLIESKIIPQDQNYSHLIGKSVVYFLLGRFGAFDYQKSDTYVLKDTQYTPLKLEHCLFGGNCGYYYKEFPYSKSIECHYCKYLFSPETFIYHSHHYVNNNSPERVIFSVNRWRNLYNFHKKFDGSEEKRLETIRYFYKSKHEMSDHEARQFCRKYGCHAKVKSADLSKDLEIKNIKKSISSLQTNFTDPSSYTDSTVKTEDFDAPLDLSKCTSDMPKLYVNDVEPESDDDCDISKLVDEKYISMVTIEEKEEFDRPNDSPLQNYRRMKKTNDDKLQSMVDINKSTCVEKVHEKEQYKLPSLQQNGDSLKATNDQALDEAIAFNPQYVSEEDVLLESSSSESPAPVVEGKSKCSLSDYSSLFIRGSKGQYSQVLTSTSVGSKDTEFAVTSSTSTVDDTMKALSLLKNMQPPTNIPKNTTHLPTFLHKSSNAQEGLHTFFQPKLSTGSLSSDSTYINSKSQPQMPFFAMNQTGSDQAKTFTFDTFITEPSEQPYAGIKMDLAPKKNQAIFTQQSIPIPSPKEDESSKIFSTLANPYQPTHQHLHNILSTSYPNATFEALKPFLQPSPNPTTFDFLTQPKASDSILNKPSSSSAIPNFNFIDYSRQQNSELKSSDSGLPQQMILPQKSLDASEKERDSTFKDMPNLQNQLNLSKGPLDLLCMRTESFEHAGLPDVFRKKPLISQKSGKIKLSMKFWEAYGVCPKIVRILRLIQSQESKTSSGNSNFFSLYDYLGGDGEQNKVCDAAIHAVLKRIGTTKCEKRNAKVVNEVTEIMSDTELAIKYFRAMELLQSEGQSDAASKISEFMKNNSKMTSIVDKSFFLFQKTGPSVSSQEAEPSLSFQEAGPSETFEQAGPSESFEQAEFPGLK
uniref:C-SKI_SMAD_bind domain-containing protein n=1 Tax=Rhabditophanes sp. KR3021 TaxID=114890 RepID=A0AC35TXS2_9BILA